MTGPKERRLRTARRVKLQIQHELDMLVDGRTNIRDILENPSPAMRRVQIYTVLVKTPKMGPKGVKKVLQETGTWPQDRIGSLSLETRKLILKKLPPRAVNPFRPSG